MKYSNKNIYTSKFIAIIESDKLNIEKNKPYTIFESKESFYIVLEKELDGYMLHEAILKFFKSKKIEVDVDLDSFIKIISSEQTKRLLMGLIVALNYVSVTPWTMATKLPPVPSFNIYSMKVDVKDLQEYQVIADSQTFARKLQDMPSNIMYPGSFVKEVTAFFKPLKNVKISVMETEEIIKKGMGCLYGVGRGSKEKEHLPKMMVISFKNNAKSKNIYGYVGKGVCFDTGGNNLKTGPNMRWMKYDMSGAAIVMGTIYALAKNDVKTNVVAVAPLVLNVINEAAQRPDDICKSYSGKTVEIDNTDAEGRLILADALTYAAKDLGATHLYDVATLTGAMIYSLGETYTGTWSTNDEMWENVKASALDGSELVWRLPFHSDFLAMMKSNFADIVNSCNGPAAGSSRAACFLKEFTEGKHYTHFDVAATADKGHVGTGIILKTLYNIAKTQK